MDILGILFAPVRNTKKGKKRKSNTGADCEIRMSRDYDSEEYPVKAVYMAGNSRHQVSSTFVKSTLESRVIPADDLYRYRYTWIYWRFNNELCRLGDKDYRYRMAFEVVYSNMPYDVVFGKVPKDSGDVSQDPVDYAVRFGWLRTRTSSWNKLKEKTKRTTSWVSSDSRQAARLQHKSSQHSTLVSPCQSPSIYTAEFQGTTSPTPLTPSDEIKSAKNKDNLPKMTAPISAELKENNSTNRDVTILSDPIPPGCIDLANSSGFSPMNNLSRPQVESETEYVKVDVVETSDSACAGLALDPVRVDWNYETDSQNTPPIKQKEEPHLTRSENCKEDLVEDLNERTSHDQIATQLAGVRKKNSNSLVEIPTTTLLEEPGGVGENSVALRTSTADSGKSPQTSAQGVSDANDRSRNQDTGNPAEILQDESSQAPEVPVISQKMISGRQNNSADEMEVPYALKKFLRSRDDPMAVDDPSQRTSESKQATTVELENAGIKDRHYRRRAATQEDPFSDECCNNVDFQQNLEFSRQELLPAISMEELPSCRKECKSTPNCQKNRPKLPHIGGLKKVEPEPGTSLDLLAAEDADEYWAWDPVVKQYYHVDSETGSMDWYEDSENDEKIK
ncbi:hypothetical protein GLAREA_04366 [Glarea lozoyensis ATCC 20868]|uniref:Uncharacterized protein n=1 Tax=Glarea lozoyensis (strain ATCC 20868 / MF5171) TaxID=1116229 RepID=S3CPE2_GLAL2|nr:uncharacterized protein GLAREA_04366 [Glarea lozoyensis ATCC 20868]EPE27575.1 hypothetical protein GLAREA_04366 [Glarea lozoyensis ATCC 20868]